MAPINAVATVLASEIEELDDNELFAMLRANNISAGPIVASTRHLYKKKLIRLLSNETEVAVQNLEEEYDENEDYEENEENEDYKESPGLRNRFTSDTPDYSHAEYHTGRKEEFVPTSRGKGENYDDIAEYKAKEKGIVSRSWRMMLWIAKLIVKLIVLWLLMCAAYYIYNNHLTSKDPIAEMEDAIQDAANEELKNVRSGETI